MFVYVCGGASAYVRIKVSTLTLFWNTNQLTWQLNSWGSGDIDDGSHVPAIEHAFQSWEDGPYGSIRFTRGADTPSNDILENSHLVLFDEINANGYFPVGAGIIGVTPIAYFVSSGRIIDADILLNGRDYVWSTDLSAGTYDVQAIVSHEVGHFIGLDHSPSMGCTMWPYADPQQSRQRFLSSDDHAGAAAVQPNGNGAVLFGRILKQNGNPAAGAMVGAVRANSGELAGTALANANGNWRIAGLSGDDYWVYAKPLEGAMSALNLSTGHVVEADIGADFYGGQLAPTSYSLASAGSLNLGNLNLPDDADLTITNGVATESAPGDTVNVLLTGSGFQGITVTSKSPLVQVLSYSPGTKIAQVSVDPNCQPGMYNLYLTSSGGEFEIASGILFVRSDPPSLTHLDVASGPAGGGTTVTLTGTGFTEGAYVLFGGKEANPVTFLSDTTLTAVTPPAPQLGLVEVSVHNGNGHQVRSPNAFFYSGVPEVDSVFPVAGQASGGTEVYITGELFSVDLTAEVGGVPATVEWISTENVKLTTPPGPVGSADIQLENAPGDVLILPGAFDFEAAPDPSLSFIAPGSGPVNGGTTVTLTGSNMGNVNAVLFGVNPVSGQGGVPASFTVRGNGEIQAVSPNFQAGTYSIALTTQTGQATLSAQSFQFLPSTAGSGGGGGGGCGGRVAPNAKNGPGDVPAYAFMVAVIYFLRRRSRL